jgi:CDP-glucose 4,6-dehydratase
MESVDMNSFWTGRRVLITGHTGFKGSWLCYWLRLLGAEVSGFALPPEQNPALFDALKLQDQVHSIMADISDLAAIKEALAEAQPEVVFHMAAQSLVKPSYDSPVETYQTNVMGTVNLLESVRQHSSVKALVVVTSDKCYENLERLEPYTEQDRLGGHDPYSNSKACAELVTASYRASFFENSATAVASARAGNVIGGGDWSAHRLVPDIVRAWQTGNPLSVRNPDAVRPWQHVLEPLSGYLLLAQKLVEQGKRYARAWNFGPDMQAMQPVRCLVETAKRYYPGFEWVTQPHPQHEAQLLTLDCSQAQQELDWLPVWTLESALEKTLAWYEAFYAGQDMREVCEQQIAEYLSKPSQLSRAIS